MKTKLLLTILIISAFYIVLSCSGKEACHDEMIDIIKTVANKNEVASNTFAAEKGLVHMDSMLSLEHSTPSQVRYCKYLKANVLMQLGRESEAITILEQLADEDKKHELDMIWKDLALAYLRMGERSNCISNHAAESCILPIKGLGLHRDTVWSRKAIN